MRERTWLCARGHVATTLELAAAGVSARSLAAAVRGGRLQRAARGVYACLHVDDGMLVAARSGCLLDCVTALARHEGLWSGIPRAGVHLRARPGRHPGPLPTDAVLHWAAQHHRPEHPGETAPIDALLQAARCLPPYDALACIESALHLGYLAAGDVQRLVALAPHWLRATLARLDLGAQSGLETHTRLLLQDAGHQVVTQVPIPGAGVLDLLVDDRVGVETDGRQWHAETFLRDRSKDIGIELWGIRVLRIGAPHVFDDWPRTLATIERMLADAPARR